MYGKTAYDAGVHCSVSLQFATHKILNEMIE